MGPTPEPLGGILDAWLAIVLFQNPDCWAPEGMDDPTDPDTRPEAEVKGLADPETPVDITPVGDIGNVVNVPPGPVTVVAAPAEPFQIPEPWDSEGIPADAPGTPVDMWVLVGESGTVVTVPPGPVIVVAAAAELFQMPEPRDMEDMAADADSCPEGRRELTLGGTVFDA